MPKKATEAEKAASANEKYGFSTILGEGRRKNSVWILEQLRSSVLDDPNERRSIRLKSVNYSFFSSIEEAKAAIRISDIPLEFTSK